MRDSIARWSLRRLFHSLLQDGQHTELFARIHQFLSHDSSNFHKELEATVQSLDWPRARIILDKLHHSVLAPWVPDTLWPQLYFLDLEYCPYRKILKEIAVLGSRALHETTPATAKTNANGLQPAEVQSFLATTLDKPGWLVGHNIRRFDLVRLAELGVVVPEHPVLDTLELSLLARPVQLRHSLEGTHRAEDDVRANVDLMRQLDEHWLAAPAPWVANLARKLDDPGLARYFAWVLARRAVSQTSYSVGTHSPSPSRPPSPRIEPGRVRRAALPSEALYKDILAHSEVAIDRWTLRGLRKYRQESTGTSLEKRTRLRADRKTSRDKISEIAQTPRWTWQQAYLLAWWDSGGELEHELHPFVRWEAGIETDRFTTAALDKTDLWEHRCLWELAPRTVRVVVHPELLYDAEVGGTQVDLERGPIVDAVKRLFSHRELKIQREAFGPSRLLFDQLDFTDPDWSTLISELAASDKQSLADLLATQDKVLLRYENLEDGNIRLQAWPIGSGTPLPAILSKTEGWTSAPACSPFLQRYLTETGCTTDGSVRATPGVTLQVAANAGLGSPGGVRRQLVSVLSWLLADPQRSGALGFGEEARHALAFALNAGDIVAHHQGRYGSRQKTIHRTADQPGIFLADSRPAPLPSFTRKVVLSRLPFPARHDPAVVLSVGEKRGSDIFKEVVLPIMLERLHRQHSLLDRELIESILFDRRALDFRFREELEAYVGKVVEVAEPARHPQHDRALERLTRALPQRPLIDDADPRVILRRLQGPMAEWRPQQETIVKRILKGQNVLAVLPTGAGKSACYQVPALLYGEVLETLTVVVSPLRALMRDQVQGLRARGIFGVDMYHGELSSEEKDRVLRDIRFGWTVLLYMAPEQLLNPIMLDTLLERGVGLFVVDEAHCISEWGHDFRPEYLKISAVARRLAEGRAETPTQIVAFTATATKAVQKELIRILQLHPEPVVASVQRINLHPAIKVLEDGKPEARLDHLEAFIRARTGQYGLIYAFRRKDTEWVCRELRQRLADVLPLNAIDYLHAKAPDRSLREREYLDPERPTRILVATTAFGMGIDKPDIDWIAHYNAPQSVEDYAQQIGRGARDPRRQADVLTLVRPDDIIGRNAPLGEMELSMVLEALRSRLGSSPRLNVEIEDLSKRTGLTKGEAKAALFSLERAGVLVVEQWSAQLAVAVKTGQSADEFDDQERALLQATPEDGRLTLEQLESLAPELFEQEWIRKQKALIRKGALRVLDQLEVALLSQTAPRQLQGWEEREHRLAVWLDAAFREQMGRPIRKPLSKLLEVMGPGANLASLERTLTCWRAGRLLFQERGLTDVRLSISRDRAFLATLDEERRDRAELVRRLQKTWPDPLIFPKRSSDHERWRIAIGGLEARNAVSVTDHGSTTFKLQIRLCGQPEKDIERLSSLDFMPRRRAHRERGLAVQALFAKDRDSHEIWAFLSDYFERDESNEVKALREKLLEGLTEQQAVAAMASGAQPLLINAGAGSGKTHVLSRRLMMLQGLEMVDAQKLLVLSFSKAGAAAIGSRARAVGAGHGLGPVSCLTFHAFAHRILQIFAYRKTLVGRRRLPRELQQDNDWRADQLFNAVMVDHFHDILGGCEHLRTPTETIDAYLSTFDALRGGHPQLDEVITSAADYQALRLTERLRLPDDRGDLPSADVGRAFGRYLAILQNRDLTDFAGMVTDCLVLLRTDDVVRRRLQLGIRHLLVDEFQDTSRAQEAIMRLLVGPHGGLTVVGDSDQTIYTFNGSDVRNILDFAQRNRSAWPQRPTRITNLEENFRSTANIVDLATGFIEKNRQRLPKTLRVSETTHDKERRSYRRRNARVQLRQTPSLQDALGCAFSTACEWIEEGVPPEQIAIISRLNPATNKEKQVLERLKEAFIAHGIPLAEARANPRGLAEAVARLANEQPDLTLERLAGDGGHHGEFSPQAIAQAAEMGWETVSEWAAAISADKYTHHADRLDDLQGLHLLTIHQSKGREFRRVIVLHLADKFFPPALAKDFEEERRVLYVALTRAEERLMVTGQEGNVLFRELLAVAGDRATLESWRGWLPSEPEPAEAEPWDESETPTSNHAPEDSEPGSPEEIAAPDFVEVRIDQTNLLTQFQAWMEDDDD